MRFLGLQIDLPIAAVPRSTERPSREGLGMGWRRAT
jgi:hypothetical protein